MGRFTTLIPPPQPLLSYVQQTDSLSIQLQREQRPCAYLEAKKAIARRIFELQRNRERIGDLNAATRPLKLAATRVYFSLQVSSHSSKAPAEKQEVRYGF